MQFPIDIIGLKLDFFISKNNEIRNRDSTREGDKLDRHMRSLRRNLGPVLRPSRLGFARENGLH